MNIYKITIPLQAWTTIEISSIEKLNREELIKLAVEEYVNENADYSETTEIGGLDTSGYISIFDEDYKEIL